MKVICIGRDGWPVEGFIGRPFRTLLRRMLLTRKITTYKKWLDNGGCKINFKGEL